MPVTTVVEEARGQFQTKQKHLADVMELAKDGQRFDFSRKSVLEKLGVADRAGALDKVKELNREIDDLAEVLEQTELKAVEESIDERDRARNTPIRGGEVVHPLSDPLEVKSFGQRFVETKQYTEAFRKEGVIGVPATLDMSLKALFQTSTGFAPENERSGLLVEKADLSLAELLDLIPVFPLTAGNAFVYMEETVRVHAAAETAEGAAYPESEFSYEEKTNPARKIGDHIPATDEQLEDEGGVASLLDQRLRYGLKKRLARQIVLGDGVAPNLRGILNTAGLQTQAKAGDTVMAAAFKALTKVRFTGDAEPNAYVFHPNDWQDIVLATESGTGAFIWGHPAMVPLTRLWGLRVAVSTGLIENSGLVGDFINFSRLDEKRGVEVQVGYIGDQFKEGKKTLRADVRVAFTATRPAAFCTITGI
jgi:HK97 family phage major capsid protein